MSSDRIALAQTELYRALGSPLGIVLQCEDFTATRNLLYAARSKAGDPSLALLQFRHGLGDGELWIIKSAGEERRSDATGRAEDPT